jgi:STE24 endopeptidase
LNEDKAARYNRLKRHTRVVSLGWTVVVLVGLLWSGLSVTLRSWAESSASRLIRAGAAGPAWTAATSLVIFVSLLMLLHETMSAPLAFYGGFVVERRYGLSNERFAAWVRDRVKALLVGWLLACAAATLLYACIALTPERWWLTAGLLFGGLVIGLTELAPIMLLPIFYRLTPLVRQPLSDRLLVLADRAGARVLGAYEWTLSDRTRKANAALTGLGATRRILISDTMLAEYSDEEIEVVLAHEIAHHAHGDIWKGMLLDIALIGAGFYLASVVGAALNRPLGLRGSGDIAGLPLLLLATGAMMLALAPVAHAISRAFERRADRFALTLTGNPAAFISAMRRLGAQNLAEERPSRIVQWLFYSHPPVTERIAAAQAFAERPL